MAISLLTLKESIGLNWRKWTAYAVITVRHLKPQAE
jgi:hypothetical protein